MATVNKQSYFEGALELLAKRGFGELRLTTLCRSLGISTGSFYNWFSDWNMFLDEFLHYWAREQTQRIIDAAEQVRDPLERLDRMRHLAHNIPHSAEVAVRAWANANPRAAQTQRDVDAQRERLIIETVSEIISDTVLARRLGILGLSIVVGHQHLDSENMDWALGQFIALVRLHADVGSRTL